MTLLKDKTFLRFVLKFLLIFALCYYGTLLVIGISVPGGYYIPFVDHYLNYVSWLRDSLMWGTETLLKIFGIDTYYANQYVLRIVNGHGIRMVYGCLGYGVMSFWIAFVLASSVRVVKKTIWLIAGLLVIWIVNISRLSLVLVAVNKNWSFPFGWDHHTWFNIVAYIAIFIMMYFFDRVAGNSTINDEVKN